MSDTSWKNLAGRFIVIDGPDGAGKSTQIAMLAAFLRGQGLQVAQTRDPGGTAVGDRIRAILLDNAHAEMAVACETMLYMASRAQLVAEVEYHRQVRPDATDGNFRHAANRLDVRSAGALVGDG